MVNLTNIFFLNEDGTLDYANMIRTLDSLILKSYTSYTEYLIKNNQKYSKIKDYKELEIDYHPYWKEYLELKKYINNLGIIEDASNNTDWDDVDWENYERYEEGDDDSEINYRDAAKDMTAEELEALFDEIEINL